MQFTIRIGKPQDLEVVQHLNARLFANEARHDDQLVMDWPHDPDQGGAYFAARLSGSDGVCFVAESADGVIGYLAGALRPNESYRRGKRSELETMFVDAAARSHGVGAALIGAFKAWSSDSGADEIFVSAYFDNDGAVAFYRSNGFKSYSHDLLLRL